MESIAYTADMNAAKLYDIVFGKDYEIDYPNVTQHRLIITATQSGCNFDITYHN